ncbi:hypothetical protein EDD16DRAFT_1581057 [Pisolithus croceorrhizus]|nr:hypothetical protein EDD16DRAFT_1581057 [Pisolithus croceorrhizus]KAI6164418.1 hypothetical protein EDD17DRAFT_345841 [Pisolithus thermaeus]
MFHLRFRSRSSALPGFLLAMRYFKGRITTWVRILTSTTLTGTVSDDQGNDIKVTLSLSYCRRSILHTSISIARPEASLQAGTSKKFPCQDGLVAKVLTPARNEDMGRHVPDMVHCSPFQETSTR